jgi:hypothetical protein
MKAYLKRRHATFNNLPVYTFGGNKVTPGQHDQVGAPGAVPPSFGTKQCGT